MGKVRVLDEETGQEFEMDAPDDATDDEILAAAEEQWEASPRGGNVVANVGIAAGLGALGAFGLGRAFRRAFPGMTPKKSSVRWLENALRKDNLDLRTEFAQYLAAAKKSDKPLTFADWLAAKPGSDKLESMDLIRGSMRRAPSQAGKREAILAGRDASQRDRVLKSLVDELQIPPDAFDESIEELMKRQPEATALGRDIFKKSGPSAKELSTLVDAMKPEERAAFGRGLVENLSDMNTRSMLSRLVAEPENYPMLQDRLKAVFADDDALARFLGAIGEEKQMTAGKRAMIGAKTPTTSGGNLSAIVGDVVADQVIPGGGSIKRLLPQAMTPGRSKLLNESIADIAFSSVPKRDGLVHPGIDMINRYGGQRFLKPSGLDWLRVPGGAAVGAAMEGSEYRCGGLAHARKRY